MDRFVVLMYHRIVSGDCPVPDGNREEARYAVGLETFRRQMDYIAGSERRGVSARTACEMLSAGRSVPPDWVVVTFDDGNRSDFVHARPLLVEYGFGATFFVGGDRVGTDGELTPEMLAQMAADGLEIGSHGMTHRFLTELSAEGEEEELRLSKELLERISGTAVDHFAPAGGRIGGRGVAALKRLSYRAVFTSEFGFNVCERDRFEFRRIPVMASTSQDRFRDIIEQARFRLLPLYAKDMGLRTARRVLGESGYRRVRAMGLGR
jgi:peptidoglycan/xylan/chitin deacetylase (PgdA/CDA1 family)